MREKLYKKENNLCQSREWLAFQENYGREVVHFEDCSGIKLSLPFGKSFVWVQKGPAGKFRISNFEFRKDQNVVFVRIEPENISEAEVNKYDLKKVTPNSLLSGQASPKATRVLDISKSEEEILAGMKPKTRYNIRLAEKKGVKVKMLDDENILYELLKKTAGRDKGYAPHEKSYYTKMMKDLSKNDAHIFFAEKDGEFLAAILVTFFGEAATYLHGGFDDQKKNLMAPYLCQWEAIKYAKNKGCSLYDFWGVAETDDPNDSWAGITRFKEGFGGEKVVFSGTYDFVVSKFWYNIFLHVAKLKHLVR